MIAAVPGEFTTMAGRRFREALNSESSSNGGPSNTKTIIAGLSNVYTHYVTTFEEYQVRWLTVLIDFWRTVFVWLDCSIVMLFIGHWYDRFFMFQVQRYEGASTIYGPHTLAAYTDQYKKLAKSIVKVGWLCLKFS